MDSTLGARLKKTAGEVAGRLGEAAQIAGERINVLVEIQHLTREIQTLQEEKERCRQVMADLLIRMFDQETFAPPLLRPEYQRIKEIDQDIDRFEREKEQLLGRGDDVSVKEAIPLPMAGETTEIEPASPEIDSPEAAASAEEHTQ